MKRIRFTKGPTFTKAIIASAIFAIAYLASTSNLPSCSDTAALLSGNGECIERQSFLHTASGWLALVCLVAAVVLLALKHKDSILGRQSAAQQAYQAPSAPAPAPVPTPARSAYQGASVSGPARSPAPASASTPASGRASNFCPKCGTRIIPGDRFCQGCGIPMEGNQS